MAASKNNQLSLLARSLNTDGDILNSALSSEVTTTIDNSGVTVYDSTGELPISGNTAGAQAFVKSTSRLYIHSGVGWYNVAVINNTPTVQSITDSDGSTTPFTLATDGTPTTITITAQDSDGDPLTYNYSADSDFGGLATISQATNVFTITPLSQDSATTASGTITFSVTDGINTATPGVQTFTLEFLSAYWDETVLSVGTSSTNSLDNDTFIDRSTNAYTIAGSPPTQTAFHPYLDNYSTYFDGTNDEFTFTNSTDFDLGGGDFTVEFWINKETTSTYQHILRRRYSGTNEFCIIVDYSATGGDHFEDGALWLEWGGGKAGWDDAGLSNGVWTHVAVVRSGTTGTLYVNGVANASTVTLNNYSQSSAALHLGGWSGGSTYRYKGWMSNVRIVKGTAIYTSAFTPPTEKLTAVTNTTLLMCQANRFIDNSSSSHTPTIVGAPEISAFNPFGQLSEYAPGDNKGSGSFDAATNYIEIGNKLGGLSNSGWTYEAWIYLHDTASSSYLFNQHGSNTTNNFGISSTGFLAQIYGGNTVNQNGTLSYDTSAFVKQWAHLVVQYENPGYKFYVNGDLVGTHPDISAYWDHAGLATTKLGVYYYTSFNSYFNGYMADVKITPDQIVYSDGYTVPTSPVSNTDAALYLPMDNAGIYDKTGNNTLTLGGDASTSTTQTKYASTSMYFDGSGDYVSVNDMPPIGNGDYTMEFWMNGSNVETGTWQSLLSRDYASTDGFRLYKKTGVSELVLYSGGSSARATTVSAGLTNNTWHHIAVVRNSGTLDIYVDGVSKVSVSNSDNISEEVKPLNIGGNVNEASNYPFTGYLENVQMFIGTAKYTTNFTPPTSTQGRNYQAES